MNPQDIQLVTDRGLPLLIATGIFCAVKLLRSQIAQSLLAMISPRLTWDAWPKPVAMGVLLASTGAGALATALIQGTPISAALTTALVALVGAMGIDSAHGAIKDPASTNAQVRDAGSLKIPIPPAMAILLACALLGSGCAHYQAHSLYQGVRVQELTATTPLSALASDAQCQSWHNEDQLLSGAEIVIGFLGGGSGLATVIPPTSTGKEALAITSVVFGAATLALGVLDTVVKNEFSQSCALTAVP